MPRRFLCLTSALLITLCAASAWAQDVLVLPPKQGEKPPPVMMPDQPPFNNKQPGNKKPPSQNATSAIVIPNQGKAAPNPGKGGKPGPFQEIESDVTKASAMLDGMMQRLEVQPTQVIEQPDYTDKDDRTFENAVTINVGDVKLDAREMSLATKGTSIKPEAALSVCEPRYTGAVLMPGGMGESFDIRGGATSGRSGYKKQLTGLNVVFAMACKFDKPPANRGIVPKFGDRYVIGIGNTECTPPKPITGGPVTVDISKAKDGSLQCAFN